MPLNFGHLFHAVSVCLSGCSFFSNVMPRGLDSVPTSMLLLVGVMVESLLVLLATLVVLRRFHAQQAAGGRHHTPDDATNPWNDDSVKATEMATEGVESARLSGGDQKTHEVDPSHRRRISSSNNPNTLITTGDKQKGLIKFPKSKAIEAASRLTSLLRASQLDWVLFAVAFAGNTVFLIVLYRE